MSEGLIIDLIIVNKLGLHARAAAKFVKTASQFQSEIFLVKDGETSNGKSIMSLLMLAAEKGSVVTLKVAGEDQENALETLKRLVESGFDE